MMTTALEELFLNTDLIGYIGPFAVIVVCALVMSKRKDLGLVCFLFEVLLIAQYLTLVDANKEYWWHIFLLLVGGVFPLALSGLKK